MCEDFSAKVSPYLEELRTYCRKLAGTNTTWEAEDLLQETMTRAYRAYQTQPDRHLHKTYLKRIAKNAWIDHWREQRHRIDVASLDQMSIHSEHTSQTVAFSAAEELASPSVWDSPEDQLSLRAAFEGLADRLSSRQMVLILLIDVFQFTARETAQLLRSTEGAVKESAKRARRRLRLLAAEAANEPQRTTKQIERVNAAERVSGRQMEAFLQAFRAGDPQAICDSYLAMASIGIRVVEVKRMADRLQFVFRDPDGHLIGFFSEIFS